MQAPLLTEVPSSLKQLARLVVRGFYDIEYSLIVDMLVRWLVQASLVLLVPTQWSGFHVWGKMTFVTCWGLTRKCWGEPLPWQSWIIHYNSLYWLGRSKLATLKTDKFLQVKLKIETGEDGKANRVHCYFINYKVQGESEKTVQFWNVSRCSWTLWSTSWTTCARRWRQRRETPQAGAVSGTLNTLQATEITYRNRNFRIIYRNRNFRIISRNRNFRIVYRIRNFRIINRNRNIRIIARNRNFKIIERNRILRIIYSNRNFIYRNRNSRILYSNRNFKIIYRNRNFRNIYRNRNTRKSQYITFHNLQYLLFGIIVITRCLQCDKQFTDLEADQLFDFTTQEFKCTHCGG